MVKEALTWVSVPYRHMGRDRKSGVDCAGLIIKVAHETGISEYDSLNYGRRPIPQDFIREVRHNMDDITTTEAGHGDVGIFAEPKHPCHCGIIDVDSDGQRWIIHAYAPRKMVVRERMTADRERNMLRAFRYREPA